jgi:hypothetical protein
VSSEPCVGFLVGFRFRSLPGAPPCRRREFRRLLSAMATQWVDPCAHGTIPFAKAASHAAFDIAPHQNGSSTSITCWP